MTIDTWLKNCQIPRLDALLLLEFVLGKKREWILAHSDAKLSFCQRKKLDKFAKKVTQHFPTAYILGKKEFFGLEFIVNKNVLIPRPETEKLVEVALEIANTKTLRILDVGTGSGAIAISLAKNLPKCQIFACDISKKALKTAHKNAKTLRADVQFKQSDLLANITGKFDIIVANLPYVSPSWKITPETHYEPPQALFATEDGLLIIKKLISTAKNHLKSGSYLLLEADPYQHESIVDFAKKYDFNLIKSDNYALLLRCK